MQFRKLALVAVATALVGSGTAAFAEDTAKAEEKFQKSQEKAPNDTGKNTRDEKLGKVTAQNQSNTKKDVDITREIRKGIMATKGLSMDAENVKIITKKGVVTLRGPVANQGEKDTIEALAKNCSGVNSLTNQLEIKGQTKQP